MSRRSPGIVWALAAVLAVYLALPFLAGFGEAGLANWRSADLGAVAAACAVSLASATLATLLVTLGGVPLGYLLARTPGRAMAALGFVVQMPLALPPLASGVLLLFLLGYSSPLGRLTNGALTDSFTGIVLAEAFVAAPFLIISAKSAFSSVDPGLEDVAATLGHKSWSTFRRVALPLAGRTILAGMLLCWLRAFGEFGATVMVAYHPYSLPVYTYVAFGGEGLPAMIPVLAPTLIAATAVMVASVALGGRTTLRAGQRAVESGAGTPIHVTPQRSQDADPKRRESETVDFAFRRELAGFNLDVTWAPKAARLAILGASGSGKSMTLRLICGLERSSTHRIRIGGRDLSALPAHARNIAYVPQNFGLFPHLSVAEQIRFPVRADDGAALLWTERLGLQGFGHRRPSELSLGQQQRVALARALSRRADLILLDEPFSALDAPLRAGLRGELRSLQREIEAPTILVTHDPDEALQLADELMILDRGGVLQVGPVDELFSRPNGEKVARLLGAENIGVGRAIGPSSIELDGGEQLIVSGSPLRPGQRVGWAVRTALIRVSETGSYVGRTLSAAEPRAGARRLALLFGGVVLDVAADARYIPGKICLFDIDPQAVQIWALSD